MFASVATAELRRTELVSVGADQATSFDAASQDGTRAAFTTGSPITSDDTDGLCDRGINPDTGLPNPPEPCLDVYVRNVDTGTTMLASTGPAGGSGHFDASFLNLSQDGKRVLFETAEQLVSQDTDTRPDIYSRNLDTGTTQLVSTGPDGGNGAFYPEFRRASADGTRVFFNTQEPLVSADTNGVFDDYVRDINAGTTTPVSTGPAGPAGGSLQGISDDGTRAFFTTTAAITPDDTDHCPYSYSPGGCIDVYERDLTAGTTTLVSTGPLGGRSGHHASFAGATPDGSHVYFHAGDPLVSADTDLPSACRIPNNGQPFTKCVDVYERSGGQTTLISTGPAKNPNDPTPARFAGATADGAHVYFTTAEPLVAADTDLLRDVYARENGTTVLISDTQGPDPSKNGAFLAGTSADASQVFLKTAEQWLSADTDTQSDDYLKSGGTLDLATIGPIGGNGPYAATGEAVSKDGRLFFTTFERLLPEDPDTTGQDIYQWQNGATTLISKGSTGQSSISASSEWRGIADGGKRFFFDAFGQLAPGDTNAAWDVYVSIANRPPRCNLVKADRALLWPADRTFRTVSLYGATDPEGDAVTVKITGVTQDEPVMRRPDARALSGDELQLRADRRSRGDGRVYRIAFTATDSNGASCQSTATVSVPITRSKPAIDSAPPSYDSFGHQ
jgi:Tol biopolymer transport system component